MKVYDTLIKVNVDCKDDNSRIRNGKIYAWCHEQNIISKKNAEDKHYFVLSNQFVNNCVICRSSKEPSEMGMSVSYETTSYTDYILLSGTNKDDKKIDRLSTKAVRHIFNQKTNSFVKKVIATSNSGVRHINIYRTEFLGVDINKVNTHIFTGIGGRITYGCGLIIPSSVYKHLMNFVK
jgi:hypothetical protein